MKPCFPKSFKWVIGLVLIALIGVGCGKANVQVYQDVGPTLDYPRTVAILPFSYDPGIDEPKRPDTILRKLFYNYFSYLGYTDLPLNTVDLKVASTIKLEGKLIPEKEYEFPAGVLFGYIVNISTLCSVLNSKNLTCHLLVSKFAFIRISAFGINFLSMGRK